MVSVGAGREGLSLGRASWLLGGGEWEREQEGVEKLKELVGEALEQSGTIEERRDGLIARLLASDR